MKREQNKCKRNAGDLVVVVVVVVFAVVVSRWLKVPANIIGVPQGQIFPGILHVLTASLA